MKKQPEQKLHYSIRNDNNKSITCKYCSENNGKYLKNTKKTPTSKYQCITCKVTLCIDCFHLYHS